MRLFRKRKVQVDMDTLLAHREEAQRKLDDAERRLAHDEVVTIRPLRQMVRENHVSEQLDILVQKVRNNDPDTNSN
jgi:hypothetical protein